MARYESWEPGVLPVSERQDTASDWLVVSTMSNLGKIQASKWFLEVSEPKILDRSVELVWVTAEGSRPSLWFRLKVPEQVSRFETTVGFFSSRWASSTKSEQGKGYSHLFLLPREMTSKHKSLQQSILPVRSSFECPGPVHLKGTGRWSCLCVWETAVTEKLGQDFYPFQLSELLRFSVFSG